MVASTRRFITFSKKFIAGGFRGGRGDGGGRGGRGGSAMKRGGGRGCRGGGMKGGTKVVVETHRHGGIFIAKGKEDALCTKNLVPGEAVYNEKRVSIQNKDGTKTEYRVWNPFRSNLAAAVLCGLDNAWIQPGARVLYLGAASGTTVSHVSDIVGPDGVVYAVEFSHRSGRDLVNMAKKRTNVIPIIEDARHPSKYRMLVGMVDVIFSDVAQPDQARILGVNASHFLKAGGHFMISIKANCIDCTVPAEAVFAHEVKRLRVELFKPVEQVNLEPFERDHACVVGGYRVPKKIKGSSIVFRLILENEVDSRNEVLKNASLRTLRWAFQASNQSPIEGSLVLGFEAPFDETTSEAREKTASERKLQ